MCLNMETITFYSYKGGVGRTLVLANIAMYLSRFKQNVCIMDFDLEAPGLHYKFPQLIKTTDIKKGLVDYIYEFAQKKAIPNSLGEFSLEIVPPSDFQGEIRLIPAGDVLSPDYWQKLASIDWQNLFYEESGEGVPFFLELKEKIKKEFNSDFLLIDSRTGVTEMSGICTSLLPERVVFLIVNNRENIEGARQILQGIQGIERFPKQKPIKITFALTRIPSPEDEETKKIEEKIIKDTRDFLNTPVEDLEKQLDIQEICVLHSDRQLELSESLRISQKGVTKETLLSREYLRLFSKIISDKIVLSEIGNILEEITTTERLFKNPDEIQQELEGLVASYPHPISLKRLIDFYILRNADREKILEIFKDLWSFEIKDQKMISKYVSFFMKWKTYSWKRDFNLEVIEKYLKKNPDNKLIVERRLAKAYEEYDNPKMALKHYFSILDIATEQNEIIGEILDVCINREFYDKAIELFEKYSGVIDNDVSLRVKKLQIMFKKGNQKEVEKLLDDGGITEKNLFKEEPYLYLTIMEKLGKPEKVDRELNVLLRKALDDGRASLLYDVGRYFYRMGREDEFKNKIKGKHPESTEIIYELKRRHRRERY